ncbi:MAG: endonuclease/exonuclease/phosphatase family protein [Chloroflexota bacterium]|nr:endonuclease/exonuclease/phosphatase family protein [Chloroflexota bacterium]
MWLLVSALAVVGGLQLLRSLVSGLSVHLGQVRDVPPAELAILIFAIFASAFAAPLARRVLGTRWAYAGLTGALALLRLAEQFTSDVDARLAIAIAGVVVWLWFMPLLFARGFEDESRVGPTGVFALLVGLTVDTAIKGAFGTLDLGSAPGLAPQLTTVALTVALLALVVWLARSSDDVPDRGSEPRLAFVIGPAIALHLLIFQNLGHHAALIGWSLPAVFAWTTLANLAALWVVVGCGRSGIGRFRWMRFAAAAVLIVAVAPTPPAWLAALGALLGPTAISVLWMASLGGPDGRRAGGLILPLGLMAIPIVLFGWYAHYEIEIAIPQWVIPVAAAVVIAVPALAPAREIPTSRWSGARSVAVASLVLLLLPLHQFLNWNEPDDPPNSDGLRVATYNIHQGFDLYGRHDLEGIALAIEEAQVEVVALQEVPRGWVVNGSVDALGWLAQRLRMHWAWGPAADPNWGNAILSRHPILDVVNRPMPNNEDLLFDRAYMVATIDLGDRRVQVVATHLHHIERESRHRLPQVRALLDSVDWSQPTILLGDLNAQPHHEELRLLRSAGLSTVQPPVATYPADRPRRQIDYVLTTDHFAFVDVYAPETTASDHLPLVATLE